MTEKNYIFDKTKVDELGRIMLSNKIRNALHVKTGENLSTEMAENIILISKENNFCVFCGREKDLIKFRYKHICLIVF